MKLRCPICGAEIKLNEASQAAELQALDKAAAAFGDDWPLVKEYLDCFSKEHRQDAYATKMKVPKRLRLARELWEMWKDGKFAVGGAWYRIGREEFREALRATCNQVAAGLTNHNYLKKVLVAAAEKTSQREDRELRAREEGLRTTGRMPVPLGEGEEDPAYRAEILRLGRMLRQARSQEAKAAAREAMQKFMEEAGSDLCKGR